MGSRKHDVNGSGAFSKSLHLAQRRSEHAIISKDYRETLLRSKRMRLGPCQQDAPCTSEEAGKQDLRKATCDLVSAIKQKTILLTQAARQVRIIVSGGQCTIDANHLRDTLLPALIRVLLLRQGGRETAEAVLEVAWAITNLAAGQHDIVKTVLLSAPALIAHLSGWLGLQVAEQCAWALGNMAGDDSALCNTLAANGAVIPLARLLLRATSRHEGTAADCESAAATAAWALSNLLWGDPSQVGHLIEVPQFPKGLVSLLEEEHDAWLHTEAAWLLAFICGGADTHMHTMVKHGAANAVVKRLCCILTQDGALEGSIALLTPLLRCLGNMGTSKVAAKSLLSEQSMAVVRRCAGSEIGALQGEAQWVTAMLSKLAQT
ncbi:ARM repeat-containing protein [Coccomyxa subellipsoidea C-169]|uniref:ARM repeat-containing protein n=1 Tax=Coccomyxa subellipsoidea (strain C-169) TaxID=574566 RepID=I0YV24_COCSC|nr:ARM repeat-containing protein [Coccomyxa subellipsoidea C-169]EIE22243.1 ARM repeat-containing protein [Coccomyxa subellipsoidea C-169]|eukprot:XP_005646787.1 ARM repeat-containing protein [Coccomyxa subellipsoidea C-169]